MYDQIAHFYDLTHDQLTADIDFVLALAALAKGPVLELGCGTGRLLRPLARAGHLVTGVDNSPAMLARAQQRLSVELPEVKVRITLIEGDMAHLPTTVKGAFALAIIPYNTILHVPEGQLVQVLRGIWDKLAGNGRLFIDTMNPFVVEQINDEDDFVVEDILLDPRTGKRIQQSSRTQLQAQKQRLNVIWLYETLAEDGHMADCEKIEVTTYYRFPHQLEMALHAAGFRLQKLLGNYDGTTFNIESERLLLLVKKEGEIQ